MTDPPTALKLMVFAGGLTSTHDLPSRGRVSLGRASDNEVCIDDPSVSRHHAALHLGAEVLLEDLGSANGTSLRSPIQDAATADLSQTKLAPGRRVAIAPGASFHLGSTVLVLRREARSGDSPSPVIADEAMRRLHAMVARVADGTISVLLLGETGVGKEVLAHALHERSPRASGPFVALHCAALSGSLLESELFGHEKGAFTGAVSAKAGLLESAEGGTVFLDEVGELPPDVQVKLLRVIEERKVLRVGALRPRPIDVRLVSATHRDLEAEVARGTFRQDLYFRLNGIALTIPPLRERVSEIAELSRVFISRVAGQLSRPLVPTLSPEALALLEGYRWPGNIRELRNTIERAVVLCSGPTILPEHLPLDRMRAAPPPPVAAAPSVAPPPAGPLRSEIEALERQRIVDALEQSAGNQTQAATLLGMPRRTLVAKLVAYNIPRPRKR